MNRIQLFDESGFEMVLCSERNIENLVIPDGTPLFQTVSNQGTKNLLYAIHSKKRFISIKIANPHFKYKSTNFSEFSRCSTPDCKYTLTNLAIAWLSNGVILAFLMLSSVVIYVVRGTFRGKLFSESNDSVSTFVLMRAASKGEAMQRYM